MQAHSLANTTKRADTLLVFMAWTTTGQSCTCVVKTGTQGLLDYTDLPALCKRLSLAYLASWEGFCEPLDLHLGYSMLIWIITEVVK